MTDNAAKNVAEAQAAYNKAKNWSNAAFDAYEHAEQISTIAKVDADKAWVAYRNAVIESGVTIKGRTMMTEDR